MRSKKPRFGMGRVYLDATAEAQRRGDRRVSTEHVALAMLVEAGSPTARAIGVDLETGRAALETLDRRALAAMGIDVAYSSPVLPGGEKERLRLTPSAKAVFSGLRTVANGERLGAHHVLLGLLSLERPDPAAELFDELGVERDQVRIRLRDA